MSNSNYNSPTPRRSRSQQYVSGAQGMQPAAGHGMSGAGSQGVRGVEAYGFEGAGQYSQQGASSIGGDSTNGVAVAGTLHSKKPGKMSGRKIGIIVGAVIAIIAIIVALVLVFGNNDDFYDGNSIVGQAPYKTTEEIQAELDRIVEEGMLNISIASVIEFEDGQSEGTAYIENVPGNRYVMQVDIALDDTGEVVYQSGGLKPGNYIEKIKLSKDLDPGSYNATATFHALDPDSLKEVGSAAAIVTLNVLG